LLQLSANTGSNIICVLPIQTGSYSGSLLVQFIYDYTNSSSISEAQVITNNNYLIMNITGSNLPTASGLYTLNFYDINLSGSLVWSTWTPIWTTLTNLWTSYTGSGAPTTGSLIVNERAWISGSNDVPVNQYLYQSQSVFIVYNG